MKLEFDTSVARSYKSNSQRARVLSEYWVGQNAFCPVCGNDKLSHYTANRPVADFFCENCEADFELKCHKEKSGKIHNKIVDGNYETIISRILSLKNPNFLFMTYTENTVSNFLFVPNYFFTSSIIEKRTPLKETAKRHGWTGCIIKLCDIPEAGKIFIVKDNYKLMKENIIGKYNNTKSLKMSNVDTRGWIFDILKCIDRIDTTEFTLGQIYFFEHILQKKHPENNFIRDKIRQQLQFLRDKGVIAFLSRGRYKKL